MKLFSCKLRLAGAVTNEVLKIDVTAAEIEVLRELHGSDSVLDIKQTGQNDKTSAQERARLKRIYASEESLSSQSLGKRLALLRNLFGHDRLPLPDDVVDRAEAEEGDEELDVVAEAPAPVRRTRVTKQPEAALE
jgi:hypothetical protein